MTKELEALKLLGSVPLENPVSPQFSLPKDEIAKMQEAYKLLEKALTPPTEEEVCKALTEWAEASWLGKARISYNKTDFIITGPLGSAQVCSLWNNKLILYYRLPPRLVTLIGRFYQSLEEKK